MQTEEQREAGILVRVNNADFDKEVANQLYDDSYKDEIWDFFLENYESDLKQAFVDDMSQKEFFAGMVMSDIKVRNNWRCELVDLVSQWLDEE